MRFRELIRNHRRPNYPHLIAAIERGEAEQVLRGRVPLVPVTAAREFIARAFERQDMAALLRQFLSRHGGRIIAPRDRAVAQGLQAMASGMGRVLRDDDAMIAAAAIREQLLVVTRDGSFLRAMRAMGFTVETW